MKRILVTGGTGLVGSHLLMHLTKGEYKVLAIYRDEKSLEKTRNVFNAFDCMDQFETIDWKKAELTDYFSLAEAFKDIEYVYHTAAKVSFHKYDSNEMMNTNINGTANIVNLCLEKGVSKLCYVSSVAALGESKNGDCVSEENDWINTSNTSNYSVSKYYAENEVWRGSEEGLDTVIVNPSYILGFGDWNESSLQIFKRVYQGLTYYSDGSNGFVDVEDVVKIMIRLMDSDIKNERFILCSENLKFLRLFELMSKEFERNSPKFQVPKQLAVIAYWFEQIKSKLIGQKPILTKESVNSAYANKCFSSEKIKQKLNFEFKPIAKSVNDAAQLFLKQLN